MIQRQANINLLAAFIMTNRMQEYGSLDYISLMSLSRDEQIKIARYYWRNFNLRVNQFVNAFTTPFALTKILKDQEELNRIAGKDGYIDVFASPKMRPGEKYYNRRLVSMIRLYQNFFNSRSSTIKGWRDIGREQDARLFGVDENNNPNRSLTDSERTRFWDLYESAKRSGFANRFGYESDQAHKTFATMFSNNFTRLTKWDLETAEIILDQELHNEEYPENISDNQDVFRRTGEVGGDYFG